MKPDARLYGEPTSYRRGEDNPRARLTEEQVIEIKRLLARGAGHGFLARRYGVSKFAIWSIAHNLTWRHVRAP